MCSSKVFCNSLSLLKIHQTQSINQSIKGMDLQNEIYWRESEIQANLNLQNKTRNWVATTAHAIALRKTDRPKCKSTYPSRNFLTISQSNHTYIFLYLCNLILTGCATETYYAASRPLPLDVMFWVWIIQTILCYEAHTSSLSIKSCMR